MSTWIIRNLHVTDALTVRLEVFHDIALHDLSVIDIKLQEQIVAVDRSDNFHRLRGTRQIKTGTIPCVDWFDKQAYPFACQALRRKTEILDKGIEKALGVDALGGDSALLQNLGELEEDFLANLPEEIFGKYKM